MKAWKKYNVYNSKAIFNLPKAFVLQVFDSKEKFVEVKVGNKAIDLIPSDHGIKIQHTCGRYTVQLSVGYLRKANADDKKGYYSVVIKNKKLRIVFGGDKFA